MVDIEDGVGGALKITLNSAIQFGFLFDPHGKRDEALVRARTFDLYTHVYKQWARICYLEKGRGGGGVSTLMLLAL